MCWVGFQEFVDLWLLIGRGVWDVFQCVGFNVAAGSGGLVSDVFGFWLELVRVELSYVEIFAFYLVHLEALISCIWKAEIIALPSSLARSLYSVRLSRLLAMPCVQEFLQHVFLSLWKILPELRLWLSILPLVIRKSIELLSHWAGQLCILKATRKIPLRSI